MCSFDVCDGEINSLRDSEQLDCNHHTHIHRVVVSVCVSLLVFSIRQRLPKVTLDSIYFIYLLTIITVAATSLYVSCRNVAAHTQTQHG